MTGSNNEEYIKFRNGILVVFAVTLVCVAFIILLFGIVLSGNTCVIIDKDLDYKKIGELLKISDSKIIYYSDKYCYKIDLWGNLK